MTENTGALFAYLIENGISIMSNPDTTPAIVIAVAAFIGWCGVFVQAWWVERRRK